jgi:diacylglycerol kinase family enzyme
MKIFHLLNPSRKRAEQVRALTDARHLGAPWAWVTREHPDHTETLVQWALNDGVQRLVVWGGDGTLHRVVKALRQRKALDKIEVALVPAGTCNDLARRMGIRFEEWMSWQADAPEGRRASMSLAVMKAGRRADVFINNAGFGRPKASFDRKDPAWRTLLSFDPIAASVRWGAGELRGLYYMGLFCLGPYFSGGLHFEPEPSPERGEIRTYLVPARSKLRLAARLISGRFGAPLADTKITAFSATEFSLKTDTPIWPQVDGEPPADEGVGAMTVSVAEERWTLWVPG